MPAHVGAARNWQRVGYWAAASLGAMLIYSLSASRAEAAPCNSCPAGYTPVADGNCVNLSNSQEIACPSGTSPPTQAGQATRAKIDFVKMTGTLHPFQQDQPEGRVGDSAAVLDWAWYFGLPQEPERIGAGLAGRGQLGMYISPSAGGIDGYGTGGAAVIHGSGYGLTDSAGVLAPGTKGPSFTDVAGGGTIGAYYDASWFLPAGQGLLFRGFFNYTGDDLTVGSIAGLAAASAGSARFTTYTFGGSALYNIGPTYVEASATGDFGNGSETNAADGSTGSFNTQGYLADLRIGSIVPLLVTGGVTPSIPTKAPPKATDGTVLAVDVSAHVGYSSQQIDGFIDSTGFVFGTDRTQFGDIGARAKLFMVIPDRGVYWMPYVAATVDQLFSYSSTLNVPVQAALPTGDVVGLSQAQTFGGGELGLDVRVPNGWTSASKAFIPQAPTPTSPAATPLSAFRSTTRRWRSRRDISSPLVMR